MSDATVPADVFLDTSVVVAAMFPGTPNADASDDFCQRLVAAGSHVYFAQIMRLDLARALRRLATKADKLPSELHAEYQLDLWRQSLTIMGVEVLDATDALHLATARWIGIADFATTDRDFRRVTHPRIHLIRDDESTS